MLPKSIWILGFVSLLMDISSEIIHGLLPVFLVSVLGSSYTAVGFIEGLGAGTALLFKIFSGPLSDRLKSRKSLVLLGYSLSTISKPFFALAQNAGVAFGAKLLDRAGKGIRGSPRDALIADIAPDTLRGKAFGLRQSLDTAGAFIGPLLAIFLMNILENNFRLIFWIATVPAMVSVILIIFGVHDPQRTPAEKKRISLLDIKSFSKVFWVVCMCGSALQLARFSEAFLILRARDFGLPFVFAPLVLVVMNVVYSAMAYPAGNISDRVGRRKIIFFGFIMLIAADLVMGFGNNIYWTFFGVALWGLHLGLTQGLLTALVADSSPKEFRGTAYGIFNLFGALALFIGSPLAGYLWDNFGASATFISGAVISAIGLASMIIATKSI